MQLCEDEGSNEAGPEPKGQLGARTEHHTPYEFRHGGVVRGGERRRDVSRGSSVKSSTTEDCGRQLGRGRGKLRRGEESWQDLREAGRSWEKLKGRETRRGARKAPKRKAKGIIRQEMAKKRYGRVRETREQGRRARVVMMGEKV